MATRTYDNTRRARLAEQTGARIVDATEALVHEVDLAEVTLAAIARGAGVTVQTVLRRMGSRDGCIEAVAARVRERIVQQRGATAPGDVDAALTELMDHYEAEGPLILKLLAQERSDAVALSAVQEGRAFHRAWVVRCLGRGLAADDVQAVDALVGATDLYLWKLYRLDLGRSKDATAHLMARLVRAILETA